MATNDIPFSAPTLELQYWMCSITVQHELHLSEEIDPFCTGTFRIPKPVVVVAAAQPPLPLPPPADLPLPQPVPDAVETGAPVPVVPLHDLNDYDLNLPVADEEAQQQQQQPAPAPAAPAAPAAPVAPAALVRRIPDPIPPDVSLTALRFVLKNDRATFRPLQEQAVDHLIHSKGDLVFVAPAGSGKSLAYLIPARINSNLTIAVIVPFKALLKQLLERTLEAGISAAVWRGQRIPIPPTVLYIQAEHVDESLTTFLRELEHDQFLNFIAFDEVHEFLLATDVFRPHLARALLLNTASTPTAYISASLPPPLEDKLRHQTGTQPRVIRERTERSNISYLVTICESEDAAKSKVLDLVQGVTAEQRIMVFCMGRQVCEGMASLLSDSATCYHSEMSEAKQAENFEKWTRGTKQIIFATSGLGVGLDNPRVALVIHLGGSHSLVSFYQESSRGGRKGQSSQSVVVTYAGALPVSHEISSFLTTRMCRRQLLHEHLDGGFPQTCSEMIGSALCDNCDRAQRQGQGMLLPPSSSHHASQPHPHNFLLLFFPSFSW